MTLEGEDGKGEEIQECISHGGWDHEGVRNDNKLNP
jgi:hypothetical protein